MSTTHSSSDALPLPPIEMRRLVGPTGPEAFDNPQHGLVYPDIPARYYTSVFEFGCGCGRFARRLIQQQPRPARYVGVDLHPGMIAWCQTHLAPHAPGFSFRHSDVFNAGFNPGLNKPRALPFPVNSAAFTLVEAWSVFTHVLQDQAEFYLREIRRILHPEGMLHSTWFLFEKRYFPMMQEFQNALYINPDDPTNAVVFDRMWFQDLLHRIGLTVVRVVPPEIRGYHWRIFMVPAGPGVIGVPLPEDHAPFGISRPPTSDSPPNEIR
jgi:SAM-dependent methyltransferase